jgi:hypothetical protein
MPADPEGGTEEVPLPSRTVPIVEIPARTEHLKFSFRHLQLDHPKFLPTACTESFYRTLLARIRDFSSWRVEDFCDENNNEHSHKIWWPQTTEPDGFVSLTDDEQFAWAEFWQTDLTSVSDPNGRNYRIHGAIIDGSFFVIWLDPAHQLYS